MWERSESPHKNAEGAWGRSESPHKKTEGVWGRSESPHRKEIMIKRSFCFLLILILCLSFAHAEETAPAEESAPAPSAQRYDLDLTFSLNPEAFPARARSRARGYAELLDVLELRGDITICEETQSFDLNAELFFRNKPEVSIPFRFYGIPSQLFLTSPIIGNQTLLFNMACLAEFAIKIKKNLETPLPALSLLYPVVYQHNLYTVRQAFLDYTAPSDVSREISAEKIAELADTWQDLISNQTELNVLMTVLCSVSSAPEAVEAELNGIPSYVRDFVSAGEPITVEVGDGTETWQNAAGQTLFSREKKDGSLTWSLTLPADENRYVPTLSFTRTNADGTCDFSLEGSMIRDKASAVPPGFEDQGFTPLEDEEEDAESESEDSTPVTGEEESEESESESEEEEDSEWPETMVKLSASGSSLPLSYPADSSFSLAASIEGALYPNFSISVLGKTENNGTVSAAFRIHEKNSDPATILTCQGTVIPGVAETVPDYNGLPPRGVFGFFSFSEYYMELFKDLVTKPLLLGLLDFVAAAPTSACQSLLDDLTDSGIMNMMMLGK